MDAKTIQYLENQLIEKFTFQQIDKWNLAIQMIAEIGNHDSHLRDDIIYPNLAHLLHDSHFTNDELLTITNKLFSEEHLWFDMENNIPYSALNRTFTSLQITILVYVHFRDNIYDTLFFKQLFVSYLDYYKKESDLRGYEKEVGWIHSVAHGADVLAQFARCSDIDVQDCMDMFQAISDKFMISHYSYVSDEDERSVEVLINVLNRKILSDEFLISWVQKLGNYPRPTTYPEVYRININVKSLLRSLYFRLIDEIEYNFLTAEIKKVLLENVKLR